VKVTILHQGDRFTRDVICDGPAAEDLASLLDAEQRIDGHAFGAWVARWMHGMLICDRPATMLEMALYLEWADGEKRRRMEEEGCCGEGCDLDGRWQAGMGISPLYAKVKPLLAALSPREWSEDDYAHWIENHTDTHA